MKIERKPAQFQPVIITLETKEELDTMRKIIKVIQEHSPHYNHMINQLDYILNVGFKDKQ